MTADSPAPRAISPSSSLSTIVPPQLPVENWQERLPVPVFCESITDRIVQEAIMIEMQGDSYRKNASKETQTDPPRHWSHTGQNRKCETRVTFVKSDSCNNNCSGGTGSSQDLLSLRRFSTVRQWVCPFGFRKSEGCCILFHGGMPSYVEVLWCGNHISADTPPPSTSSSTTFNNNPIS